MSTLRFQALHDATHREPVKFEESDRKSALFGKNVFNQASMKQFLTGDAYKGVQDAMQYGKKLTEI